MVQGIPPEFYSNYIHITNYKSKMHAFSSQLPYSVKFWQGRNFGETNVICQHFNYPAKFQIIKLAKILKIRHKGFLVKALKRSIHRHFILPEFCAMPMVTSYIASYPTEIAIS